LGYFDEFIISRYLVGSLLGCRSLGYALFEPCDGGNIESFSGFLELILHKLFSLPGYLRPLKQLIGAERHRLLLEASLPLPLHNIERHCYRLHLFLSLCLCDCRFCCEDFTLPGYWRYCEHG
jgi:hypothetical protein